MDKNLAWLLGYLLSDGSIATPKYRKKGDETHLSFICKYSDRDILEKVKRILQTRAEIKDYPNYKSPCSKLRVYDRKDIIEKYKNIKSEIPEDIKGFERHFIRGLFDGDGTLSLRKSRSSFRIGFIDEKENITQWVSDTITKTLMLDYKKCRFIPQSNVFEVMWEGTIARLIAYWLYHGDIENCCLKRKLEKYRKDVLSDEVFSNNSEEILFASNAYIDNNNEIAFKTTSTKTLPWCKRLQKILPFNTIPVFHNKGKRKYYHLYIPDKTIINTQSTC